MDETERRRAILRLWGAWDSVQAQRARALGLADRLLREGLPLEDVLAVLGVSRATWFRWKAANRPPE